MVINNSNNDNKITQEAEQKNQACSPSSCLNFGSTTVNIGTVIQPGITNDLSNNNIENTRLNSDSNNNNAVLQTMGQTNLCKGSSSCDNVGTLTAELNGENNQEIDQSLNQNNLCVKNSTCSNNGNVGGGSGSNDQSNTCVSGSSCSNIGTNNKNTCTNGASCNNAGLDTKVISNGDTCNSGADGSTTICSHGRIIAISSNPNLTP